MREVTRDNIVASSEYPQHDVGNAGRLVLWCADELKYAHRRDMWYRWAGRYWRECSIGELIEACRRVVSIIYMEAGVLEDSDEVKTKSMRAKWAAASSSEAAIRRMIAVARGEPALWVEIDSLDSDPFLLNLENCTLNVLSGEWHPHTPDDLITKMAPACWNSQAVCPTWTSFLYRIMGGSTVMIEFLQRAVGYSLTGDVGAQVLFFLHGDGANGKSTFIRAIQHVMGNDQYSTVLEGGLLMAAKGEKHSTGQTDLFGARFAVASEARAGRRFDSEVLTKLTGGDTIKARRMRENNWSFEPTHKIWLMANNRPHVDDITHAMWRRIRLIEFSVTIPEDERDPLMDKKLEDERDGILAWAVQGAMWWGALGSGLQGLSMPLAVTQATEQYQRDEDEIGQLLEDCTEARAGAVCSVDQLYQTYVMWCAQEGITYVMSKKALSIALRKRGLVPGRQGNVRVWCDVVVTSGLGSVQM